jgi:hypothetical protein
MDARELAPATQPGTEQAVPDAAPAARLDPTGLLALQRTIGNAAVGRLLQRRVTMTTEGEVPPPAATGADAWTEDEIRAIQREIRRLRLYDITVDGILGRGTDQGLTEAFGSQAWRQMSATEVHERLRAAERPAAGGGKALRSAELFSDGVLDVTFGIGFIEAAAGRNPMSDIAGAMRTALEGRGYTENGRRAAELLAAAGRPLASATTGAFYVKENAFSYAPPAGESRQIHSIVRVVYNDVPGEGAAAADAFREGMTSGDASFYIGHGRYGTGPDFDRNFIEFRLYDDQGRLEQTIDSYQALETVMRGEARDPWQAFMARVNSNRIVVELSNAGNLRMAPRAHGNEFGARLIQWALERSGTPLQTGESGELATGAAANPQRRYRVIAFYGCSTNSYDTALRDTAGFGTREADVLVTNRTTSAGAEITAFLAFLDGIVGQGSAQRMLSSMNQAMRADEARYSTNPWQFTGLRDNPRR